MHNAPYLAKQNVREIVKIPYRSWLCLALRGNLAHRVDMSTADSNEIENATPNPGFKWVLVVFPAGIFLLGFVSMIYYLNGGFDPDEEQIRGERAVAVPAMSAMMSKLEVYAPQRGLDTEDERIGLRRTMTMIESSLGARNAGYELTLGKGFPVAGELWSAMSVEIPPKNPDQGYHLLVCAATAPIATQASALAVMEALASNREAKQGLLFVVLPVGADEGYDQPLSDRLAEQIDEKIIKQVLVLGDLGSSEQLVYRGEFAESSAWLALGMVENEELRESTEQWRTLISEKPVLLIASRPSSERLDAVSQAEVAKEIESMIRRLIGL